MDLAVHLDDASAAGETPDHVWGDHCVTVIRDASISYGTTFSVCTLVADGARYRKLLDSFAEKGFDKSNTEFFAFDNRSGNVFDGFTWLRRVLPEISGKYILFCHDDIELVSDGYDKLVACLESLDRHDDNWILAGNAGHALGMLRTWESSRVRHVIAQGRAKRHGTVPSRVESLDENFFVMRRDRLVLGSIDLSGFHFYASDLALHAEVAGGNSYVIPFEVLHKSAGRKDEGFYEAKTKFVEKFRTVFPGRRYMTTTGAMFFGLGGLARKRGGPHQHPEPAAAMPPEYVHDSVSFSRSIVDKLTRRMNWRR